VLRTFAQVFAGLCMFVQVCVKLCVIDHSYVKVCVKVCVFIIDRT
jgi:hypothetical protein